MTERPPIWLIAVLVPEVLFALLLLYIGVSISGAQLRAGDILAYSAPLVFVLASFGFAWWLWLTGKRALAVVAAVLAPLILMFALVFVLAVGL